MGQKNCNQSPCSYKTITGAQLDVHNPHSYGIKSYQWPTLSSLPSYEPTLANGIDVAPKYVQTPLKNRTTSVISKFCSRSSPKMCHHVSSIFFPWLSYRPEFTNKNSTLAVSAQLQPAMVQITLGLAQLGTGATCLRQRLITCAWPCSVQVWWKGLPKS